MPHAPFCRLAALAACAAFAVPAVAETAADTVLATVGDTAITLGHVASTVGHLPDQYRALPDEVLLDLITDQLIRQTALAEALEGAITPRMQAGLDNERRAFLAATMLERLDSEVIGEDALRAAYEAQYAQAAAQTEYNAAHILVETREEAEEIAGLLADGADFADLARERSIGPSGPRGGDLGWFAAGTMVPPFEEAVVALQPGQVSGPVQTQFGWHVVRLNDIRAATPPAFDEVREQIEAMLRQERLEAAVAALVDEAGVTRPDTLPDAALIRDPAIFDTTGE